MPVAELQKVWLLSAHARLGCGRLFETLPFSFAFFREPVDRTLSAYWHLREEDPTRFGNPEFREVIEECKSRSVEEIAFDSNSTALGRLVNVQTWYLSGPEIERRPVMFDASTERETVGDRFELLAGKTPAEIGHSDLSVAKEALSALSMFGITESMGESLQWFEARLGLDKHAVPRVNRRKLKEGKAPVSTRVRDRIGELNTFDRELYSFALSLFRVRVQQQDNHGGSFRPFSAAAVPGAPFREVEQHVRDGFVGGGWYPREEEGDDSWCWNGFVSHAWIDLFMEVGTDLEIVLEIAHWLDWALVERTEILVNGVALPTQHKKWSNGGMLKAKAPVRVTGEGILPVRISVAVPETKIPAELWQANDDRRKLCLALRRYAVRPV